MAKVVVKEAAADVDGWETWQQVESASLERSAWIGPLAQQRELNKAKTPGLEMRYDGSHLWIKYKGKQRVTFVVVPAANINSYILA